ncbi:beta strand repeat-containing protein [Streptomyces sp. NPDC001732]
MARRHSTGWEVLGFGEDPTPGDPEAIRTLARTYQELGDGAGEAVDLLRDDGAIRRGKGQAMDALKTRINKDLPGLLSKTRDSFRTAAGAYDQYANTLTDAQDMLDRAIDQGQEVAGTANTEVPALAPDASPEQAADHQSRQGEVNAAKEQLSAAVLLGQEAQKLREEGSTRASIVLDDAAEQAIPARDFVKAFGDFLADNPFVEIITGILVAIVAVFLPVVGLILGAILFAVSVIRMVSQGKIDAGEIIVGLLTLVPGGVLLGGLGKVVAAAGKLAKFAPFLAKVGKGIGTTSAAVGAALKSSTFVRKVIDPLAKGLVGLKTSPALALAGKFGIDVSTEFSLGFLASGLTALFDGKKFDAASAAKGAAIGAATAGALTVFGGTKFANNIKDAFVTKGKFKSNIGKAFSLESVGVVNGQFKPGGVLFVDTKGMGQKTGFHGINGTTKTDASTGEVKTKVTTPDGTKTEAKTTPPGPKADQLQPVDDLPFAPLPAAETSTKTTTPDGFASKTEGGVNTITSPAGDTITSNGTTTTINTPIEGPTTKETVFGALGGEFAPAQSEKPVLSTELGPNGFTTSGPFGGVSKDGTGTTTFSSPGDGAGLTPEFTVNNNTISTPGGLTVTDGGGFTTVAGGGLTVDNQNGITSVFNGPGDGGQPVASHNPADGSVDVNFGNTTINGNAGNFGGGVTLPDGTQVSVGNAGGVNVTNGDGGGQTVSLPPANAGGPITVADGNVTTSIPQGGGATITTPGGPTTTLDNTGFTVNTGGPNPETVQFNGAKNTLDVTPPGGQPQVSVGADGGISTGGIKTDGGGGGAVTGGGGAVEFSPFDVKFSTPDGTSLTVGPQGRIDLAPAGTQPPLTVGPNGDIAVGAPGAAGVTFTTPDGGSVATKPGGGLDVTPAGGQPQVSVGADGGISTGGIKTDGTGGGTVTGDAGKIEFSPFDIKISAPDGSTFSLNPNGKFNVDGISHGADGVTIAGSTSVDSDGSASIAHGGQEIHVDAAGTITATDAQGNQAVPGVPQPTPGNPVNVGNTTISVNSGGGHSVTVHGTNGTTVTVSNGSTTVNSGPIQASHGPNGVTGTLGGPNPIQVGQGPNGVTTVSQNGTSVSTGPDAPTTVGPQGQAPAVTVNPPTGENPAQVTTADGSTAGVHADGTVTKSAPDGPGSQTVTVGGGGATTVTTGNGSTTVNSGPFQASHGPNGVSGTLGGLNPVQVDLGPNGVTTVSQGGTSVSTGPDAPTTVGPQGQAPAVTVNPATDGAPTQVTTVGGSNSTLTGNGAQTNANGATSTINNDGTVTTQAQAGPNTTVTNGPNGTTAFDNGGGFGVDNTGTVTNGPVTVTAQTDAGNNPVATFTDTGGAGAQATVGPNGIDAQGVTTTVNANGDVAFTHQPAPGATTTVTSGQDGTITTQTPDGSGAQVPPRAGPAAGGGGQAAAPAPTTVTNGNGGVLSSDGQTITYDTDGFTTTIGNDGTGPATTTVHHDSGVVHTVDNNGQATVTNSPSGATVTGTNTQVTVNTPQQEGWGLFGSPDMTGGQNTLSNGPNGPTITTHGVDPVSEPGSTVVHGPNAGGPEGEFSVTYGPASGTFAPGGVTALGPSGTHVDPTTGTPIDTAGNPIGNGPGQTSISTVNGDGHSGITVPTPGGGPTVHHDGFFGGATTVDTANSTLGKSPGDVENAGTAGQKAGVVDGPHNPLDPAPAPGPETFTAGGNGGPTLDAPVGGKGGSTAHGGTFDVKANGDGSFEVSVPGGGNGPGDTVTIGPDGTLNGPGVTVPGALAPGQEGPAGPPQVTFSNNTTVTGAPGTPPVVTAGDGGGTTTTINNGTATTTDAAGNVTITQNPDGTATFSNNAGNENTTFTFTKDGVEGTVTTTDAGGNQTTFHVDLNNNGSVQVKDGNGNTLTELDAAGSYNEQHTPIHDYHAHTGGPTSVTELHEYGYEALTSILKGAVSQAVGFGYEVGANGADPQTTLENAGIKLGYGVGNSLAGKKVENDHGFKTKGPEVPLTSIPTKTIGGLNANQDTQLANPPEEAPIKV